ncbi:TPA: hypothetical protein N2782_001398 [Vibrio parahaemolyticus]|uniref:Uncharacterized protein n=1 Tax=Vibrio parahaemolyticus TaxID=670 RepID=A0A7M1W4G2_VIBPH|nr:hypothetical protein VP271_00051 [Vibrio parahaemolyticus]HCM0843417.1 hypothetical protein [Vibrio parahaemolyticus]
MKKLILHVGMHKTASTAIQETLYKFSVRLEEQGWHYPCFTWEDRLISNHSIPIYSLFTEQPDLYSINIDWQCPAEEVNTHYKAQLDRALEFPNVILSGEDISTLSVDALKKLKSYLECKGFEIEVLGLVREPYEFWNSATQERIKNGSKASSISFMGVSVYLSNLLQVFSNVRFFDFKDACAHSNGPVGFFLDACGIDVEMEPVRSNDGMCAKAISLLEHFNQRYPKFVGAQLNPERPQYVFNWLSWIHGKPFKLDAERVKQNSGLILAEAERIHHLTGIEFARKAQESWYTDVNFRWPRNEALFVLRRTLFFEYQHKKHIVDYFNRFEIEGIEAECEFYLQFEAQEFLDNSAQNDDVCLLLTRVERQVYQDLHDICQETDEIRFSKQELSVLALKWLVFERTGHEKRIAKDFFEQTNNAVHRSDILLEIGHKLLTQRSRLSLYQLVTAAYLLEDGSKLKSLLLKRLRAHPHLREVSSFDDVISQEERTNKLNMLISLMKRWHALEIH